MVGGIAVKEFLPFFKGLTAAMRCAGCRFQLEALPSVG
jgi:hypothetical protein